MDKFEQQETITNIKNEKLSSVTTLNELKRDIDLNSEAEFYKKAKSYWSNVPATVNGMLGGLGYISSIDIQGSWQFLRNLKSIGNNYALDCGAGIGRVTKNLLMPHFNTVDLVEQDKIFAEKARTYCITDMGTTLGFPNRLGNIYNLGLQQYTPEFQKYDLIWSQWVLGHLTDTDLLAFFRRVYSGLTKNGYFVIKENVSTKEIDKDDLDSSVTRPLNVYESTLRKVGFRIVKTQRQQGLPKGLYSVYMIAACHSK